jgi:hypothetical protein
MSLFDFAPSESNNVRPIQLGLCVLDVANPPEEPHEPKEQESEANGDKKDPYLDAMKVEVVDGAWVMLFPAPFSAKTVICARTTSRGQVVRIERGEIGGAVPEGDNSRLVFVNPGTQYLCYWSYHQGLFRKALADVDKNLNAARRRHPFFEFVARPWRREHVFDAEFDDRFPAGKHDHDKLSFLLHNLGRNGHGYVDREHLAEANRDPTSPRLSVSVELFKGKLSTLCWIFARRPAINVTYLAEFAMRYALHQRTLSAPQYARFGAAMDVIAAAKTGRRLEELDKELRALINDKYAQSADSLAYVEQYWNFAWQCATRKGKSGERMERKLFERAIAIRLTSDWQAAAREIYEAFEIIHPAYTTKDGTAISKTIQWKWIAHPEPLLSYFDIYKFGAENAERSWVKHVEEANQAIGTALGAVGEKLREEFVEGGGYLDLLQDLAAHVKEDSRREDMQRRYFDAAEDSGYNFWDTLPEKKGEGAPKDDETGELEVERPDRLLDLKPYIDVAFISPSKQNELLAVFFALRGRVLGNRIANSQKEIEKLFSKVINLNEKVLQAGLDEISSKDVRLEVDFKTKKLIVQQSGVPIGDMEFVVEDVGKKTRQVRVKTRSGRFRTEKHKVPVQRVKTEKFEPFKEFEAAEEGKMKLPHWFSAFGYGMLVAYDLLTLSKQLQSKEKIDVYGRITSNCAAGIASLAEALEFVYHAQNTRPFIKNAIETFGKVGKVAGKVSFVVEAFLSAKEGTTLLFNHEESEVSSALEEGNTSVANLQEAKGILLLGGASSATVLVLFFGGVVSGGIVLAAVGIVVAAIDLVSWLASDGSSMRETSAKLNKALGKEFGADYAPYRTEERFEKCRTHERIEKLVQDLERIEKLVAQSHQA